MVTNAVKEAERSERERVVRLHRLSLREGIRMGEDLIRAWSRSGRRARPGPKPRALMLLLHEARRT